MKPVGFRNSARHDVPLAVSARVVGDADLNVIVVVVDVAEDTDYTVYLA